ncbi:hypothetical protein WJ974_13800 [Achromobacter xylosoxidans]
MPVAVAVTSASIVSQALLSGDLETALLAVQTNRTQLLDKQLSSQITAVQQKNEQAAKLNAVMSAINTVMAQYPKDGDSDATIKDWDQTKVVKYEMPLNQALKDAGITDIPSWSSGGGNCRTVRPISLARPCSTAHAIWATSRACRASSRASWTRSTARNRWT